MGGRHAAPRQRMGSGWELEVLREVKAAVLRVVLGMLRHPPYAARRPPAGRSGPSPAGLDERADEGMHPE